MPKFMQDLSLDMLKRYAYKKTCKCIIQFFHRGIGYHYSDTRVWVDVIGIVNNQRATSSPLLGYICLLLRPGRPHVMKSDNICQRYDSYFSVGGTNSINHRRAHVIYHNTVLSEKISRNLKPNVGMITKTFCDHKKRVCLLECLLIRYYHNLLFAEEFYFFLCSRIGNSLLKVTSWESS